jgi:hypothetical protein
MFLVLSLDVLFQELPAKAVAGYDPKKDVISEDYEAGAWLIYDCEERHWACVLESYYRECAEKREREVSQKDDPYHSCAAISQFPNKRSCFERMLFLTTQNFSDRVCVKESWKEKSLEPKF